MKMENMVWMCAGAILGLAVTFYETDVPQSNDCVAYKIRQKVVTAYVLKPPPPIIEKEICPAAPVCVSSKAENDTQTDLSITDDTQKPRHRRHRKYRRYWK